MAVSEKKIKFIESEKPESKRRFLIMLGFILLLYGILIPRNMPPAADALLGSLAAFLTLLMAFYFGYPGLVVTFLCNLAGMVAQLLFWRQTGDSHFVAVFIFIAVNSLSAVFIALGIERIKKKVKNLEWLSVTDELTRVYNHRYLHKRLEEEISRASRSQEPLGFCMIDMDRFKLYNDIKGHAAGDVAIESTARVIKESIRRCDVLCRYGGDEFSIIFPNSTPEDIITVMKRVSQAFDGLDLYYSDLDESTKLTLSVGFSVYPQLAGTKDELFSQADNALYHAKSLGRNRIEQYKNIFGDTEKDLQTEKRIEGCLKALLLSVSERDKYTYGHSERVANYSVIIGKALEMSEEELDIMRIAGLLHDIGNIEIPESILNKKEALTDSELEIIRKHSTYSANIVRSLAKMGNIVEFIRLHHERFDGKGYPDGISGAQIPLGARILAVADAFDAMQSGRPYREAMSVKQCIQELEQNSGTQFDPYLVKLFVSQFAQQKAS